jgi:hypothetical protein
VTFLFHLGLVLSVACVNSETTSFNRAAKNCTVFAGFAFRLSRPEAEIRMFQASGSKSRGADATIGELLARNSRGEASGSSAL